MSNHTEFDIDKLPFYEYAGIMAERGAAKYGHPDTPKMTFEQIVASDMTFSEIEAEYGEETAINAGIVRDPDTWELTEEDSARIRPASEAVMMSELNDNSQSASDNAASDDGTPIETDEEIARRIFAPHREAIQKELDRIYAAKPWPPPNDNVAIWIDRDIVEYFQAGGMDDWRERLNETLRQAMHAEQDSDTTL